MLPPSCCTVINGTAAPTQSDSADHAAPARFYRNCRLDLFCVARLGSTCSLKGQCSQALCCFAMPPMLAPRMPCTPMLFPNLALCAGGIGGSNSHQQHGTGHRASTLWASLPLCHTSTACPTHIMPPLCPISPLLCVQGCAMANIVSNLQTT